MTVAIVNDMLMAVESLRRVIAAAPGHQVLWVARDGAEAVQRCAQQRPDLILMDLIMPVMDGVEATRRIMAATPCAILVVTASVSKNSAKVYEAMGHGALDATSTPALGDGVGSKGANALLAKIGIIEQLVHSTKGSEFKRKIRTLPAVRSAGFPPLLALGASAGGPDAVATVLSQLPEDFPAAVAVVQHIDQSFSKGLASWLNQRTRLKVRLAAEGSRPEVGVVDVAGTNDHLVLTPDLTLSYTPEPRELAYRPSVDVFFQSLVTLRPGGVAAVLLTGMGRDGAQGLLELRRAGHYTVAQDQTTSVVYGMPRAAAELNAAVKILPLNEIANSATIYFGPRSPRTERKPI